MTPLTAGIALALLSSITTAVSHSLLKSGRDRLAVRAVIGLTCGVLLLPGCFLAPAPQPSLIPWLIAASVIHTVYTLVLIVSYQASDFSVAFPLARGVAPIASAFLGLAFLGDHIDPLSMAGIAMVTLGIAGLAFRASLTRAGAFAAISAGLLTTTYTIVDARGMRLAPDALTFISWFFVMDGAIMFPIFAIARRGRVMALLRAEGRQGIAAGVVSTISYGSALLALRLAPAGIVSALRETTVVFGIAIAASALRERVGLHRAGAAVVIAAGAGLILAAPR